MKYIFVYVYGFDSNNAGLVTHVWSEERDRNYERKHMPYAMERLGIHNHKRFVAIMYVKKGLEEPRCGWRELSYTLGTWHLDSL